VTARGRVRWALPAAAAAIYLAAVLLWVGGDRRSARAVFPAGSVWNTGDKGLSLAYAYLAAVGGGGKVAVMTRSLDATPLPVRAVLFRVEPSSGGEDDVRGDDGGDGNGGNDADDGNDRDNGKARHRDAKKGDTGPQDKAAPRDVARAASGEPLVSVAEAAWVRGGGRLVLAIAAGGGALEVTPLARPQPAQKVFPIWPGVERLLPDPERALGGLQLVQMHVLWVAGEAAIVARVSLGEGDLIVLSCPEVLHNELLARGDHLALLAALAGRQPARSGMEDPRPVYFDERTHGAMEKAGVAEILNSWGLGPLLVLLCLAAAAAWWRAAVRVGPAERDDLDVRSDAVELLDSLADLYHRALGRGDALRLYRDSLTRTVAADTGLKGAALAARVAGLAPGLPPEVAEAVPAAAPAAPGAPAAPAPPSGGEARAGDLSPAAFRNGLQILNEAFRRLDDAKRR
jgi:hypothetical protein